MGWGKPWGLPTSRGTIFYSMVRASSVQTYVRLTTKLPILRPLSPPALVELYHCHLLAARASSNVAYLARTWTPVIGFSLDRALSTVETVNPAMRLTLPLVGRTKLVSCYRPDSDESAFFSKTRLVRSCGPLLCMC